MVEHTGVEPAYPVDLKREVQISFRLPTRYVTDRATMPHYSSWWELNPHPSVAISYNCSLSIPQSPTTGGALPNCRYKRRGDLFQTLFTAAIAQMVNSLEVCTLPLNGAGISPLLRINPLKKSPINLVINQILILSTICQR